MLSAVPFSDAFYGFAPFRLTAGTLTSFDIYLRKFDEVTGGPFYVRVWDTDWTVLATMLTYTDAGDTNIPDGPVSGFTNSWHTCDEDTLTLTEEQEVYIGCEIQNQGGAGSIYLVSGTYNGESNVASSPAAGGIRVPGFGSMCINNISGTAQVIHHNSVDKSASSSGTSTTPSSGATATLSQADEAVFGLIATEGPVTDTAGTWTTGASNVSGNENRDGSIGNGAASNVTVSGAAEIVSATTAQTAAKTGITSRDWAALIISFKLAAEQAGAGLTILWESG